MEWKPLFQEHIATRQKTYEHVMQACKLDGIVIDAGALHYFTEDDMTTPFRPYHHFAHWCPTHTENHVLWIRPGQKPLLLYFAPQDFWHEYSPLGNPFWADSFKIEEYDSSDKIWDRLKGATNTAYIGPNETRAQSLNLLTQVKSLKERLNWYRSVKSEYEIACTDEASRRGAMGHRAAKDAFLSGASELEIHYAYLRATEQLEREMPYETIVALNEKGATLHYHYKRPDVRNGKSLLIDAGGTFRSYNSDITRTYCAPSAPADFKALLQDMDVMQQEIARNIRAGKTMADLHHESNFGLAELLLKHNILQNCGVDKAIDQGFTRAFYPHGLGHMLGIFVHDVAGQQKDEEGTPSDSDARYPKLRTTRALEVGNMFTVEPGLYFIEMLLAPFRSGEHRDCFNWKKIEELKPCGGIRIEDDVVITADGVRNLTRPYLP